MKLKNWWQRLKYWQKGAVIGLIVGIFLVIYSNIWIWFTDYWLFLIKPYILPIIIPINTIIIRYNNGNIEGYDYKSYERH